MRITFELLGRMDRACREHGCRLLVVVIPTKETVFADYLLRDSKVHLRDAIADVVGHERVARERLMAFLDAARIPHVDTLAALRSQVSGQLYTRSDRDMHPGRNGYRVIGQTVAEYLQRHPWGGDERRTSTEPSLGGPRQRADSHERLLAGQGHGR
jgi:hypothetical protein